MAHVSLNNARGLHIESAEDRDRRQYATHTFRYRGATVESLRTFTIDATGADPLLRAVYSVCLTLPGETVGRALQSERPLGSHAEAAGYAMGAADSLLAERKADEDRYRTVQKRFHQLGRQVYGDEWDEARAAYVRAYTEGRTSSSKALSASELQFFIGRWETLLAEREGSGDGADVRAGLGPVVRLAA